ncbi:protein SHQ1 homolog [Melanaphis sacchari]|uniref:Protein SHQ1 homolog n=2 Tax=Melanaphis sacchari TaxID=742174 RepID=A0A2H8TGV2_9HEMI|nr:protein SHQ1 homolog [Melanaphis sacchari]
MLTPNFELKQTDDYLIIKIKARFANLNDTEIDVNGNQVTFYSSPYYLRLHLPGEVAETDSSSGFYDWDLSIFTITLNKVNPGEHFPDLNLINKFLTPKKTPRTIKPSIEVLNENKHDENNGDGDDDDDDDVDGDDNIDCNFLQKPILVKNDVCLKYGFGNQTQDGFNHFNREFFEIIEISNLDNMNYEQRKSSQAGTEFLDFCDDHYLADLMTEPDGLKDVLNFKPFWYNTTCTLNDSQKNILKSLGNKEYLLSKDDKKSALLSLVDIIYAYCFCIRTNLGEENSESPWLINKLSSTLSWFRIFETFDEAVKACIRRSVCYPLYRRWDLSVLVLSDVRKVFENGCVCLLTCLLDIHELFNSSEPRYVLNQLYIKDYCIWIQQLKSKHFETIVKLFDKTKIVKKQVGFDLEVLEVAAKSVNEDVAILERAQTSNSIVSKLQKLQISNSENSLDSDDDEEESPE